MRISEIAATDMPRRLRIEMAGGVYHVTNRGVDRTNIVRDSTAREQWYRLFARTANRCHWRIFAEVLMTNHFHILFKSPELNLSSGLHAIESGYVTYFNERQGTLFQGSFHAMLCGKRLAGPVQPQPEWLNAIVADQTISPLRRIRQRALQFAREWK